MKKINILILIFFMLFSIINANAQDDKVIPPSPNSASLGKYGDFPTNYYTGTPSINLPLYTIESGDLQLPISLSYHASGVKVAEEASCVGLGWILNAGGAITRQIIGIDDLDPYKGYPYTANLVLPQDTLSLSKGFWEFNVIEPTNTKPVVTNFLYDNPDNILAFQEKLNEYHNNLDDSHPDIFYYNFNGYSGKFFLPKTKDRILRPLQEQQSDLKIEYINDKWMITDGKGVKYYFGSFTENSCSQTSTSSVPGENHQTNAAMSKREITSWYIEKIINQYGDSILFDYTKSRDLTGITFCNMKRNDSAHFNEKFGGDPGFVSSSGLDVGSYTMSNSICDEVYLNKITSKNVEVTFSTADRLDRYGSFIYSDKAKMISGINIKEKNGYQKDIWFESNYFNKDKITNPEKEKYLRLKLNGIYERIKQSDGSYVTNNLYKFIYDETALPKKNSKSIDLWGYYNGKENTSIVNYQYSETPALINNITRKLTATAIPFFAYFKDGLNLNGTLKSYNLLVNGGNRESNANFATAGILKQILYPTGGSTEFNYELKNFTSAEDSYYSCSDEIAVTDKGTKQASFTLNKKTFVFLSFDMTNAAYSFEPNKAGVMDNMTAGLFRVSDGVELITFKPAYKNGVSGDNNAPNMQADISLLLDAGTYNIKCDNGGYSYLSLSLKAKYINRNNEITHTVNGGGIRIKNIRSYIIKNNITKLANYKEYLYNGGIELSPKLYIYNDQLFCGSKRYDGYSILDVLLHPSQTDFQLQHLRMFENSVIPMGNSAQGCPVGYSTVIEKTRDVLTNNFYTVENNYRNCIEKISPIFIPNTPNYNTTSCGQLIAEKYYDSSNMLVKKIDHIYNKNVENRLWGLTTFLTETNCIQSPSYAQQVNNKVTCSYYKVLSEWWVKNMDVVTSYNTSGNIVDTIRYEYNNPVHKQLTSTQTVNSDGSKYLDRTLYPNDINQGCYATMSQRNMHEFPIEHISYKNGKVIDSKLVTYTIDNNRILANERYSLNKINNLNNFSTFNGISKDLNYKTYPDIQFTYYSKSANIKTISKGDGVFTTYLWGYNDQYPVAEINNATYERVKANTSIDPEILSAQDTPDFSILNQLQSKIPEAIINLYKYTPLFGINLHIDQRGVSSNFEYDYLKRLKKTTDNNNNVISSFDYNYQSNGIFIVPSSFSVKMLSNNNVITNSLTSIQNTTSSIVVDTEGSSNSIFYYWYFSNSSIINSTTSQNDGKLYISFTGIQKGTTNLLVYAKDNITGESKTVNLTIVIN